MTYDCCCCFTQTDNDRFTICTSYHYDHVICFECIINGVKVAIGDAIPLICPMFNCKQVIYYTMLRNILIGENIKLYNAYRDIFLYSGNNDTIVIIPNKQKHNEMLSNNFFIRCCNRSIIRGDACNELTCPICRQRWCWWCKQKISTSGLEHYTTTLCKHYGDPSFKLLKLKTYTNIYYTKCSNVLGNIKLLCDKLRNIPPFSISISIPIPLELKIQMFIFIFNMLMLSILKILFLPVICLLISINILRLIIIYMIGDFSLANFIFYFVNIGYPYFIKYLYSYKL
jgi:hypothetical protein